jgi:hypothetical protein
LASLLNTLGADTVVALCTHVLVALLCVGGAHCAVEVINLSFVLQNVLTVIGTLIHFRIIFSFPVQPHKKVNDAGKVVTVIVVVACRVDWAHLYEVQQVEWGNVDHLLGRVAYQVRQPYKTLTKGALDQEWVVKRLQASQLCERIADSGQSTMAFRLANSFRNLKEMGFVTRDFLNSQVISEE